MFLNDFLPYPSGNGASAMTWAIVNQLINTHHDVVICRYDYSGRDRWGWLHDAKTLLDARGIRVLNLKNVRSNRLDTRYDLLRRFASKFRGVLFPRMEDFYGCPIGQSEIMDAIACEQPDIIYLYSMRSTGLFYSLNNTPPVVASIVDLTPEWREAARKYKWNTSVFRSLVNSFDAYAERHLAQYMLEALNRCDIIIEHAAHHASWLQSKGVRCVYLPNPIVDPVERGFLLSNSLRMRIGGRMKISLIGSLRGVATLAGLHYFANEVLPLLKSRDRDIYEFHIIGSGRLPPALGKLSNDRAIMVRGYVPNIEQEFLSTDILFVPTPITLGFRTRIAEGFAYGCVVVAHEANKAGMPELRSFENCILCSRPDEFLEAFDLLKRDFHLRQKLSMNARRTFKQHYDAAVVVPKMVNVFRSLI